MIPNSSFSYYKPSVFAQSVTPTYPLPPPPPRGRGRGATSTGGKRGRKPRGSFPNIGADPHLVPQSFGPSTTQLTPVQWAQPITQIPGGQSDPRRAQGQSVGEQSQGTGAAQSQGSVLSLPGAQPVTAMQRPGALAGADDDGDAEDDHELLPAMADDDFAAQSSWNSQSKDNLKVLMDNFSPEQYDRFEAYRRHALPKQAVRKVIQQTLGQQVSQPVAQIVAGFAKVFVGEIVEKARAVQERRGETGPLSPDHLREAYRMYQEETGRVGAARPLRSKRLFVR